MVSAETFRKETDRVSFVESLIALVLEDITKYGRVPPQAMYSWILYCLYHRQENPCAA